jgi:hypothetical protein
LDPHLSSKQFFTINLSDRLLHIVHTFEGNEGVTLSAAKSLRQADVRAREMLVSFPCNVASDSHFHASKGLSQLLL